MTVPYPVGTYVKVREQDIWGYVVEEYGNKVIIEDDASEWEAPDNRLEYRTDEVEAAIQHTPGPWATSSLPNGTEWTVSVDGGDMLADLTGCPNEAANAKLIASAPELFQLLHDARRAWLDGRMADVEGILTGDVCADAIAKATGAAA